MILEKSAFRLKLFASESMTGIACLGIALFLVTEGCGPDAKPRAPGSKPNSIDGTGADPARDPDGAGPSNPGDPSQGGVVPGTTDPTDPSGQSPTSEQEAYLAQQEFLRQTLPACGIASFDQYKTEKLSEQVIESAPWQRSGKGGLLGLQEYSYSLRGSFGFDGTLERIVQSANIGVVTSSSTLGKDRGDSEAQSRSGAVTASVFPMDQRHTLHSTAPAWDDIYCTVQAVSRLTNTLGSKRVVTEFSPPLAYWVSPKADPFRYTAELGSGKVWNEITATVVESNDAGLKQGLALRGTVRVDQVPATASILNRAGAVVSIEADVAYKLTYAMEAGARNAEIGLPGSITFYIDQKSRRYKAVVMTTAGEDALTISQVAD